MRQLKRKLTAFGGSLVLGLLGIYCGSASALVEGIATAQCLELYDNYSYATMSAQTFTTSPSDSLLVTMIGVQAIFLTPDSDDMTQWFDEPVPRNGTAEVGWQLNRGSANPGEYSVEGFHRYADDTGGTLWLPTSYNSCYV